MTVIIVLIRFPLDCSFTIALVNFCRKIFDFAKVYRSQGKLLLLTVDFYTQIVNGHFSHCFCWQIPVKKQVCFCKLLITKSISIRNATCDCVCDVSQDSINQKRYPTSKRDTNNVFFSLNSLH